MAGAASRGRKANTKEVLIFSYSGRNVVWPPYVAVKPGERISFKAVNTAATIFLPQTDIFDEEDVAAHEGREKGITLKVEEKRARRINIKGARQSGENPSGARTGDSDPAPGVYPYSIYCAHGCDFAEGRSSPAIIIEPPEDRP